MPVVDPELAFHLVPLFSFKVLKSIFPKRWNINQELHEDVAISWSKLKNDELFKYLVESRFEISREKHIVCYYIIILATRQAEFIRILPIYSVNVGLSQTRPNSRIIFLRSDERIRVDS